MILNLSPAEYAQLTCDIEQAVEELSQLSTQVDWFCSESPERLEQWLTFLKAAKEANAT